ncbi:MAG TPA: S8 family peptidase, partial [Gammaproteobacteria bacterium]|nr:S8 family peptidase [Gammaproteobacteria bacterium]
YVHGIGNKPAPDVLKCQWDKALFDFDLGERSRLAYWVSRAYYPEPSPGSCATGDLVSPDELAGPPSLGARAFTLDESIESQVSQITTDKAAQRALLGIARKLDRGPSAAVTQEIRAREVHAKITPFPRPVREWLTRRLTGALLRDVNDLFFVEERRASMRESFRSRLAAGGGPFIVIGHSQGSMIAYDVLCELSREDSGIDVALFVTIGSPLGIQEVQDQLKTHTKQKKLAVPGCVRRWLNVADLLDPVAFDKRLGSDFAATNGVRVEDDVEWNHDSPRHPHSGTGYLRTKPVRRAVREAVDTALFQPVAPFIIAREVVRDLESASAEFRHKVLIELSDPGESEAVSLDVARQRVVDAILDLSGREEDDDALCLEPLQRYVAAHLSRGETERLANQLAAPGAPGRVVRRVWRNGSKCALLGKSVHTVQAYPAHAAYMALGHDVNWGVLDSGIAPGHAHFKTHSNIKAQFDCTKRGQPKEGTAADEHGHGTHVAGIIAGQFTPRNGEPVTGIAPKAGLYVYKVLDRDGNGDDAWIIKALDHIAATNERAGRLAIHGINLSLGGSFDQSSYACGHSPLCRELKRLWRQGVLVVIAAGNEGFMTLESSDGPIEANMDLSIGDPANLEEALAVGSVHKENPHSYGISYFSSRGPTADGRQKPDCVAPGERILSCRHDFPANSKDVKKLYVEMSGTSMAAPHVTGICAAFLSIRREFIGQPDKVKEILLANCTDLGRDRPMQGAGLPNLVRMLV